MKVLLINKMLYPGGGDAVAMIATGKLLAAQGHEVSYWGMDHPENPTYPFQEYFVPQVDYRKPMGVSERITSAANILYSREAKKRIDRMLDRVKPDIVHLHNFAHQISPSILHAIKRRSIPMVMTMHDYKLVCPVYTLMSPSGICEKCRGGRYYHCLVEKCAKESRAKSLVNALEMYLHHRILHIYDLIDIYISPSRFLMEKVRDMGFSGEVRHASNYVELDEYQPWYPAKSDYVVYAGRLSREKGLNTLLSVMQGLPFRLVVAGDGPIKTELMRTVKERNLLNVEFPGYLNSDELKELMAGALFSVLPSEWYENNPRSIMESFALGRPVIGSRIGGIPELIKEEQTGLLFEPGNAADLRETMLRLASDATAIVRMGKNARAYAEQDLNADVHYKSLLGVYQKALGSSGLK